MNPMQEIKIEKITINIGVGKEQSNLEKAMKLIKTITGIEPIKTITKKRIPSWGVRPGLPLGCKITIRKAKAKEILKRLLEAKDNKLTLTQFDERGNVAFGIHEYIEIPGIKYDPEIGIIGLQVCVTLERPGYRVKKRKNKTSKISKSHLIKKQESIEFMKKEFKIQIAGEAAWQ